MRRWAEKRPSDAVPAHRPGVTINRRDLVAIPVPDAKLLWRHQHVREMERVDGGHPRRTTNVRIAITVDGVDAGETWSCGLEFDYANEESLYCRPLGISGAVPERGAVPPQALRVRTAYLPPMSGLAAREVRLDQGAIQVAIGEGRTADVLRNLCYQVRQGPEGAARWGELAGHMRRLFGVGLAEPTYVPHRGEITMGYAEPAEYPASSIYDLSSAGRGLQQTLLLLAYLYASPGSVLLLDEPDAHLEILRQQQMYQVVAEVARGQGSQVVAASHSEVILTEAAGRDTVIAFVGAPHRIGDRGTQVAKALRQIGFDQYYLAETVGWVLYLEGSTDLAVLRALARRLEHPAARHLERPFVRYVENQPQKAREHFHGLREAKPDVLGLGIFDHGTPDLQAAGPLQELAWARREIENYIARPEALLAYARTAAQEPSPLFEQAAVEVMRSCIERLVPPIALADPADDWWLRTKMSDDFLDRLFALFFARLHMPNLMRKNEYYQLADHLAPAAVDADVRAKLDAIVATAERAAPAAETDPPPKRGRRRPSGGV